jgi:DNA-binding CsgD family transcriptional regulator
VPLAQESLAWWEQAGFQWGIAHGLQTLAAAASISGNQTQAARHYDRLLDVRLGIDDDHGLAGALGGIAGVAAGRGDLERAARLLGASAALRQRLGVEFGPHHGRVLMVDADVRSRLSAEQFAAAFDDGRALTRAEAVAEARALIAEAIAAAPEPRVALPGGLTPREVDVVRLVAAGRSNAEIGEALFISVPTVKRHLTNILGKLDLPSRSALNTWAHHHDLT